MFLYYMAVDGLIAGLKYDFFVTKIHVHSYNNIITMFSWNRIDISEKQPVILH